MILSIESSCDDSSIAITKIESKELVFHKKISQEKSHSEFGGVVPELASRLHAKLLPSILEQTKEYHKELKAIAVTNEPGLSVTLVEGMVMSKALSLALNLPIIPINHLVGHIYSLFIGKEAIFPMVSLLVSGGHTMIVRSSEDEHTIEASTLDDSFGESFDKCAKLLSLGYPGGPIIEKRAKNADATRFDFPKPLSGKRLAFSYSGIKNAFRLKVEELGRLSDKDIDDLCASFQKSAIDHLLKKFELYLQSSEIENISIVGGASANMALRSRVEELANKYNKNLLLAPLEFCSDNAAMIGRAALNEYIKQRFISADELKQSPKSTVLIETI
ncbi:MAG: tRNA (adenosine(37)-N6)-threonylcarbamoyltransferase complex transferase subunit TsaD [Campylobacterales bacterium]